MASDDGSTARPEPGAPPGRRPLIAVSAIHSGYGRVEVLRGVTLDVHEAEVVTVVGPNGAGKTTLLRTICGLVRARSGAVTWRSEAVKRPSPARLAAAGLVYVPEEFCVFGDLTVKENLDIGALAVSRHPDAEEYERIFGLFPILSTRRKQRAGTLSGGEQRMLGIARGLLAKPSLLILDEPTGGLAAIVIKQLAEVLVRLHADGLSILMAEQNLGLVEAVSERTYLVDRGVVTWHGASKDVSMNRTVAEAVLGRGLATTA